MDMSEKKLPQRFTLATVLPLDRSIPLTYFTARSIAQGMLVTVPLGNQRIRAVVTATEDLNIEKDKLEIKSSAMKFKKIAAIHSEIAFIPEFFPAVEKTARFFAFRPEKLVWFFARNAPLKTAMEHNPQKTQPQKKEPQKEYAERRCGEFVFQSDEEERYAAYKSLIREEFAAGRSVALCLPTVREVSRAAPILAKGIEEFVFTLHGKLRQKKAAGAWNGALAHEHPVVIVTTPHFIIVPRADIATFIVEKEMSPHYRLGERAGEPSFDVRRFVEYYARAMKARVIFGDTILSTEMLYRRDDGALDEFAPLKFRSLSSAASTLVSMKKKEATPSERPASVIIGDELAQLISEAEQTSERWFLLCGRKGLSPATVCQDCGAAVRCAHCGTPLVLRKTEKKDSLIPKRAFACRHCGTDYPSRDVCDECGSWRLSPLGIGTEGVEEELRRRFPGRMILRLDEENAKTAREKKKIMDAFANSQHGILVGTEASAVYIEPRIASVGIVSIDALLSLPDFRIGERLFSSLIDLRGKALRHFFVQTRMTDHPIWKHALSGDLANFYRGELAERKQFQFPPFSLLIKISYTDTEERAREAAAWLVRALDQWKPLAYPAFTNGRKNSFTMHTLIKVDSKEWPNDTILRALAELPEDFEVRVDPESIL